MGVTEYKIKKILSQMEVSKVKNEKDVFSLRSQMDEMTQETLIKILIFYNVLSDTKLADLMAKFKICSAKPQSLCDWLSTFCLKIVSESRGNWCK